MNGYDQTTGDRARTKPMFRFTIRDVLWLTVVVALVLDWAADHRFMSRRYETLYESAGLMNDELLKLGRDVRWQFDNSISIRRATRP